MARKKRRNMMRACGTCKFNTGKGKCEKQMPLFPNVRSCHGWEQDGALPVIMVPNNLKREPPAPIEEKIMSSIDPNKCIRYAYFPAEAT